MSSKLRLLCSRKYNDVDLMIFISYKFKEYFKKFKLQKKRKFFANTNITQ